MMHEKFFIIWQRLMIRKKSWSVSLRRRMKPNLLHITSQYTYQTKLHCTDSWDQGIS